MAIMKIAQALSEKKVVEILYEGSPFLIEPYLLGISTEFNCEAVKGYLLEGGKRKKVVESWKVFEIHSIEDVKVLDSTFKIRKGYDPVDKDFSKVLAKI